MFSSINASRSSIDAFSKIHLNGQAKYFGGVCRKNSKLPLQFILITNHVWWSSSNRDKFTGWAKEWNTVGTDIYWRNLKFVSRFAHKYTLSSRGWSSFNISSFTSLVCELLAFSPGHTINPANAMTNANLNDFILHYEHMKWIDPTVYIRNGDGSGIDLKFVKLHVPWITFVQRLRNIHAYHNLNADVRLLKS